jgi:hypothetical protein
MPAVSPPVFRTVNEMRNPYLKPLPVNGYTSGPSPVQLPFLMLKTESKEAITINIIASAKCLPGQIRFPNPNTDVTNASPRKLPSGLMNRSGLKESGSGYVAGS